MIDSTPVVVASARRPRRRQRRRTIVALTGRRDGWSATPHGLKVIAPCRFNCRAYKDPSINRCQLHHRTLQGRTSRRCQPFFVRPAGMSLPPHLPSFFPPNMSAKRATYRKQRLLKIGGGGALGLLPPKGVGKTEREKETKRVVLLLCVV